MGPGCHPPWPRAVNGRVQRTLGVRTVSLLYFCVCWTRGGGGGGGLKWLPHPDRKHHHTCDLSPTRADPHTAPAAGAQRPHRKGGVGGPSTRDGGVHGCTTHTIGCTTHTMGCTTHTMGCTTHTISIYMAEAHVPAHFSLMTSLLILLIYAVFTDFPCGPQGVADPRTLYTTHPYLLSNP